jgi:hypothetical protein
VKGWVSLARDFSALPPEDPDFQRAFSDAHDVLYKGRSLFKPTFCVDLTKPYALEFITSDDLARIFADAKSDPKLARMVENELCNDPCHDGHYRKWAVDRRNNSYLLPVTGLSNPKSCIDGYMFVYKENVFSLYLNWLTHNVSVDRDFKSNPPKDASFQRAFSEACNVYREGRLLGKVVFSAEQQDKE